MNRILLCLTFITALGIAGCVESQRWAEEASKSPVCLDGVSHYVWPVHGGEVYVPHFNRLGHVVTCEAK